MVNDAREGCFEIRRSDEVPGLRTKLRVRESGRHAASDGVKKYGAEAYGLNQTVVTFRQDPDNRGLADSRHSGDERNQCILRPLRRFPTISSVAHRALFLTTCFIALGSRA